METANVEKVFDHVKGTEDKHENVSIETYLCDMKYGRWDIDGWDCQIKDLLSLYSRVS